MTDAEALMLWRTWVRDARRLTAEISALTRALYETDRHAQLGSGHVDHELWPGYLSLECDTETGDWKLKMSLHHDFKSSEPLATGQSIASVIDHVRPRVALYFERCHRTKRRIEAVISAIKRADEG